MSLFGSILKKSTPEAKQVTTPLDLVTYVAGLASNPADIDPYLDNVRRITATHSTEELSSTNEEVLFRVYLQIEQYLTSKDPIRTYTQEELRARLSPDLSMKLSNYTTGGTA